MKKTTVAEQLVQTLVAADVRRVYGVVGDSLNGITDAIRRSKEIEWVHMRHEEAGAFAAGAEAGLTNSLAVCAGSCGPGNLHLINGLFECHRSRVPVLAIAAQISTPEIGGGFFQETHPERLFQECSHYCECISHPSQMPRVLEQAIQNALGRRGVGVVVVPGDVALQPVEAVKPRLPALHMASVMRPTDDELARAVTMISATRKITILGGVGCARAHDEVVQLAALLNAPIVHALRGKEHLEYDNPYDVGLTGFLGYASGYHAMMDCELLLMLGTDFPYQQFYPDKAKVIQLDLRPEIIGRRTRVELGLVGDVRDTLRALLPMLRPNSDRTHLDKALKHYHDTRKNFSDQAAAKPGRKPIHPQAVAQILSEMAAPDAIFTCDVGTPTIWAARYLKMNGLRQLVGSFVHGSMASALAQAIGAQLAFPKRQVVAMAGDGGFAMLMGDFLSLKQLGLPVKVVIFNNSSLSFVEMEMKTAGLLNYGTELKNPNFADLAESTGMLGIRIEDPAELRTGLQRALDYDGPALVDVVVNRQELSLPPHIQLHQALGMSLYMAKAVLSGHGDEVLDLAKTNLAH